MKSYPKAQVLSVESQSIAQVANTDDTLLVVQVDQRNWMRFLADDWLYPTEDGWLKLGFGCVAAIPSANYRVPVTIYVDRHLLPNASVGSWRQDEWIQVGLDEITPMDSIVAWPGPIPLSAVHHFSVDSDEARKHLIGIVQNFEDLELPPQPIEVAGAHSSIVTSPRIAIPSRNIPPAHWNALRGAAAMAVATVPSIAPWLDRVCSMFSPIGTEEYSETAPWLGPGLWEMLTSGHPQSRGLWQAIIEVFATPGIIDGWAPQKVLEQVCARASTLAESDELLDNLYGSTTQLLQDRGSVEELAMKGDLISLAFQLVLLRHTPERYLTWREDWRAIPPVAWWTGAILTGYLRGFRALPNSLKGKSSLREALAIRTWGAASASTIGDWKGRIAEPFIWYRSGEFAVLSEGGKAFTQKMMSARGLWYELDLENPQEEQAAFNLAKEHCPAALRRVLTLGKGVYPISRNSHIFEDKESTNLFISDKLELELSESVVVATKLNHSAFKDWLVSASISFRLPRPTEVAAIDRKPVDIENVEARPAFELQSPQLPSKSSKRKAASVVKAPDGLIIIPDFISSAEEASLLADIEVAEWSSILSRRVQHYGWRYDYKARGINRGDFLGPLPDWAASIAKRLVEKKLVDELPDQVIVNEYLSHQGISKHIDCRNCFRGSIVTISLLETWEMVFARTTAGIEEKYRTLLPRYSATVLSGEVREKWTHEIAKKKTDAGYARNRRVSVTFRKVAY